ncbi:phosphoribosyltransferase-like protein [Virgisporangium aurantiacum]|uniref:Uncharacterized protein n=1 Tax=Virgisporangium aurantiacum TaxID=175570 RepID=A0A8J4DZY7_9ACTN|nr:hypothetical protein [Virgisporangium aurantiacum]GIJ56201.1 hypothetical protein Vau01_037170 [Virgisporangium aurantiacum]
MADVQPSETSRGRQWLTNFVPDDVPIARTLLDGLRVLSEDEFRSGLTRLLTSVVEEKLSDGPVALYPVRPPPTPKADETPGPPTYVEPNPARPIEPDAGSELIVANIITEITKTFKNHPVHGSPDLDTLRLSRCRTALFVDDYSGTGRSVRKFLAAWQRNATIRSWRSYHLLRFHLVTYAWSPRAEQAVGQHVMLDGPPRAVEYGLDFDSAPWDDDDRVRVRQLCKTYALNTSKALGYRKSEGTLAMVHTAPNNLPNILFEGKRQDGEPWISFFPEGHRRLAPVQQLELGGYRPPGLSLASLAARAGNERLAEGKLVDLPRTQPLMLVLAQISCGVRRPDHLTLELSLSSFEVSSILKTARELQFVDDHLHLTDRGHEELRHAQMRPRRVTLHLQGSDEPYYPVTLRGAVDI